MTADNLIGLQLDEYRVEALLGRGGMARVYRGIDTRLNRYVAIKVIDAPLRTDSEYVVRFEREAQAIAKLEHANIVRLYRYGEAHNVLYMAMQFIEGSDLGIVLRSYHSDQEFIEPEEALQIIREVCGALDYAHSKGVIHRDIKPSNIMLDKQGQAYLADFGLALLTEVGTRGEIFGSPHYIAPEQAISSAGAVPQSDLYSVGIILYEMFTGQCPFDADTPMDIALKHMSDPPPPPREIRPEIAPALENVILKAIEKEPGRRYASGKALAEALERALAAPQMAVPAHAATTLQRRSVPERVAIDFAANALPPIPAAVTPSDEQPTLPPVVPAPPPPVPAALADGKSRYPFYAGALIGAFLGLVVLAGLLMLLRGDDDTGEGATAPGEVGAAAVSATMTEAPTATAFPSATASPMLTVTPTPTRFVMRTATLAPAPTLTPVRPTVTALAPAAAPVEYTIVIAKRKDDSLFVVNQGETAFPLAPLRIEGDRGSIDGAAWGIVSLRPGECVAVWKDNGKPKSPKIDCDLVGPRLTRGRQDRFWKSKFTVFYGQEHEYSCKSDQCSINIAG